MIKSRNIITSPSGSGLRSGPGSIPYSRPIEDLGLPLQNVPLYFMIVAVPPMDP